MRHRVHRRRLGQKPDHTRLIVRNLATSLILYEAVETTRNSARVLQPFIDQLFKSIRDVKPQVAVRRLNRVLFDRQASRKVMEVLRDRFRERPSGLTRIVPLGSRRGDGAKVVRLSFVDSHTLRSPAASSKSSTSAKPSKA